MVGSAASQHESTALIWAAAKGHAEIVRYLLDRGASLEARNEVRLPTGSFALRGTPGVPKFGRWHVHLQRADHTARARGAADECEEVVRGAGVGSWWPGPAVVFNVFSSLKAICRLGMRLRRKARRHSLLQHPGAVKTLWSCCWTAVLKLKQLTK